MNVEDVPGLSASALTWPARRKTAPKAAKATVESLNIMVYEEKSWLS